MTADPSLLAVIRDDHERAARLYAALLTTRTATGQQEAEAWAAVVRTRHLLTIATPTED